MDIKKYNINDFTLKDFLSEVEKNFIDNRMNEDEFLKNFHFTAFRVTLLIHNFYLTLLDHQFEMEYRYGYSPEDEYIFQRQDDETENLLFEIECMLSYIIENEDIIDKCMTIIDDMVIVWGFVEFELMNINLNERKEIKVQEIINKSKNEHLKEQDFYTELAEDEELIKAFILFFINKNKLYSPYKLKIKNVKGVMDSIQIVKKKKEK